MQVQPSGPIRASAVMLILLLTVSAALLAAFQKPFKMTSAPPFDNYEKRWKSVDSLEEKGLTKSALEKTNLIYDLAKKSDNAPQVVKSLIYKAKYRQVLDEGGFEKTLSQFETEINSSKFPVRNILQSAAAELYWSYYQQNRWRFTERTQTVNFNQDDIATWDLKTITSRVTDLYKASLNNTDSLKQLPIDLFSPILEKGNMDESFRPSLYDFLAHRALDFFMNEEAYLTQPAYHFNISGASVFAPAEQFIQEKIATPDTSSGKFLALQILRDLLRTHLHDNNPAAFLDVELKRFSFLKNSSVSEEKDSLYVKGLLNLESKYAEDSSGAAVSYAIAQFYFDRSADYQPPLVNDHRWDKKTALMHCDDVIRKFPGTHAANNCAILRHNILAKNNTITTEQVNLPGIPFRSLVEYRNTNVIYLRIIANTETLATKTNELDPEKLLAFYLSQPVINEWSQTLPAMDDYQQHGVEIKMPALQLGSYIVLAATDEKFSGAEAAVVKAVTSVSNISYVSKRNNLSFGFYVMDRETGEPMAGAKARLLSQVYNVNDRNYSFKEIANYTADKTGYFEVPASPNTQNFRIEFSKGDDHLFADDYFYLYRNDTKPQKTGRTIFFTDRAIYRPGQTIYFKGIMVQTEGDSTSLSTKFKTTVELLNVNGQKVSSLDLVTNEYGSFNGSFTAPANGLNGEMRIRNGSGSVSISIEEYKRPRFEVVFDTLKGSFRLNDQVTVTATAKSYAGANLDGAIVNYRVIRVARFPIWYARSKYPGFNRYTPEMEITSGTTTTDANGAFQISFTAIPDLTIPQKENPQFDYRVMADVVDISGETHSAETNITIGYVAINADISIPENVSRDSVSAFKLTTENLNGIFEALNGKITVYSLQEPGRIFRDRLWNRPDQFAMTKEEFYKNFPNDVYDNENDFTTWEKKSVVSELTFNSALSRSVSIPDLNKAPQGKYLLELSAKDKYGADIIVKKYFTLYDAKSKEVPLLQSFWNSELPSKTEAGTTVPFQLGTAEKDITVIYEIQSKDKTERKVLSWKKGKELLPITISENFKGGVSISALAIKHGRAYGYTQTIYVPYTEKELKLEFETFRNKLLPGQQEEWKLKISGSKGEPVAAEMVASMYDASLDAFRVNEWNFDIDKRYYPNATWTQGNCFSIKRSEEVLFPRSPAIDGFSPAYDQLNWFGLPMGYRVFKDNLRSSANDVQFAPAAQAAGNVMNEELEATKNRTDSTSTATVPPLTQEQVSPRKNLAETAFFYPNLETDANGNVVIKFTIPDALTRWKFMGFAHSKALQYGFITKETVTQKDLMITPNAPRFFRVGDKIYFSAKVSNLSEHDLTGTAALQLFDAVTMKPVDALFANANNTKSFTATKGQSAAVSWELTIPAGIDAVDYQVTAKAGNQSDGEENVLPVISNEVLITESMPLNIRGSGTKDYKFTKLLQSGASASIRNYSLTLEVTSNPAWYAVQAFPYLMEYPYECSEQIFNRFYSNALASAIANSNPKVKQVFEQWKNQDAGALLSNLEKNQELKSLLLEETPWVMQGQDESERKKRIALLFDLNKMSNEMDVALNRLQQLQTGNGGWAWFAGGPDDRYITQYIMAGIGHLQQLKIPLIDEKTAILKNKAIPYLDNRIREEYENLIKYKAKLSENQLSYFAVQYLYARSYFNTIPVDPANQKAVEYYKDQAQKYWTKQSIYAQGMIALSLQRYSDKKTPLDILASLKENSITNEETGMYWKSNTAGYYWYQAPIETQVLLIEAFDEVGNEEHSVENMKLWLLKQKQTNDWRTTKATAEAVYALLLRGGSWLMNDPAITVALGKTIVDLSTTSKEAGTGYFKTSWKGNDITPGMGDIKITRQSNDDGVSWGAVYWQYFEQLDKVTAAASPLSVQKKLFVQRNSSTGPVLEPITSSTVLKVGDIVKVRMEVRTDRDMEYIHLKDQRAAGFEPLNVLSGYRWQDGLGYYEETKDAATNFFFDRLPKGTYVFEYPLRAQLKGDFSAGIASIQCMYAPEFTAHSEGTRVIVQ
jgi:uncharacterized protein YfaS (alpha-2-macroglobulin family)